MKTHVTLHEFGLRIPYSLDSFQTIKNVIVIHYEKYTNANSSKKIQHQFNLQLETMKNKHCVTCLINLF
jgi:hypothetical protein